MAWILLFIVPYKTYIDLFAYARDMIQIYRPQESVSFCIHWPSSLLFPVLVWTLATHVEITKGETTTATLIVFEDKTCAVSHLKKNVNLYLQITRKIIYLCTKSIHIFSVRKTACERTQQSWRGTSDFRQQCDSCYASFCTLPNTSYLFLMFLETLNALRVPESPASPSPVALLP